VHLHTNPEDSSQDGHEDTGVRERAIKARQPNYAGWWTEILNYHTTPQTSVYPSAFNIPDNKKDTTASSPSADEIKKGYGNTLPRGKPPSLEYNTLPRAASTGSATFVTGTGSTLSAPAAEYTDYHGFKVPIKPSPPGAEDCCMRYVFYLSRQATCFFLLPSYLIRRPVIQRRRFFVLEKIP
jgi:hypothetical protein